MTIQEAIGIMKIALAEVEWEYPMDYAAAFETAIEALEKQIPKKPIEKWTGDEWVIKCPVCGKYVFDVSEYEWARQFCGGCGQAIDWECDTDE